MRVHTIFMSDDMLNKIMNHTFMNIEGCPSVFPFKKSPRGMRPGSRYEAHFFYTRDRIRAQRALITNSKMPLRAWTPLPQL